MISIIEKLGKAYYGVLHIPYGKTLGAYHVFAELPQSCLADTQGFLLADTENNLIMLAGTDYQDLYTTVFEISYKKDSMIYTSTMKQIP